MLFVDSQTLNESAFFCDVGFIESLVAEDEQVLPATLISTSSSVEELCILLVDSQTLIPCTCFCDCRVTSIVGSSTLMSSTVEELCRRADLVQVLAAASVVSFVDRLAAEDEQLLRSTLTSSSSVRDSCMLLVAPESIKAGTSCVCVSFATSVGFVELLAEEAG